MLYHQKMNHLLDRLTQERRWYDVLNWGEQWIRLGFSPESAYRLLIKVYAGSGNLGMISIACQRCVEALNRDLGVDPSSETTRLYEHLWDGGLDEHISPASLVTERSNQPPFFTDEREPQSIKNPLVVACEREFDKLDNFLDLALAGQGRIIFVTGEAGSGKTTLVNEFTRRARKNR